jgi:hypothetical protein
VARLARARRSLRWRVRARYPAQRLLDVLPGHVISAPILEAHRARIEELRGVLARAGFHPDAVDLAEALDHRRPDLRLVVDDLHAELCAVAERARPLAAARLRDDPSEAVPTLTT